MKYNFKQYTNNDYEFIYNIKKNAYKKYVEENWGLWDENFQRKLFDKFIADNFANIYIIEVDNEDIGFYNGLILENDDYEISNICIIPEYQNKGIGTQILKDILDKYINKNIRIQYFKQNPVGNLYKRLGFIKTGETDYHFQMIKYK